MGSEVSTREMAGPAADSAGAAPHELIFQIAMARIEALTAGWQQVLAGFPADLPATPASAPADEATPVRSAADAQVQSDPAETIAARAATSRWRRHLAA